MVDDVDLVEEDEGIKDGESGVVEDASEYDIFEVEQAVGVVDLAADLVMGDGNDLLEFGRVGEVLAVVGAVGWEVGVVCVCLH